MYVYSQVEQTMKQRLNLQKTAHLASTAQNQLTHT